MYCSVFKCRILKLTPNICKETMMHFTRAFPGEKLHFARFLDEIAI